MKKEKKIRKVKKLEKGFILYDALVSLIVLTGFITFFNQMVVVTQNQEVTSNNQILAINEVREKYYTNEETKICSDYETLNEDKKVCFE